MLPRIAEVFPAPHNAPPQVQRPRRELLRRWAIRLLEPVLHDVDDDVRHLPGHERLGLRIGKKVGKILLQIWMQPAAEKVAERVLPRERECARA